MIIARNYFMSIKSYQKNLTNYLFCILWILIFRLNFTGLSILWAVILDTYSKVPNNSAACLLIFKIFSYQHSLIWTYTLIKIQIIFLPTRLLSTIFYSFFYLFSMLFAAFFCYKCFNNAFFSFIFLLLLVSKLKKVWNCF